jgi:hypothetical protein
VKRSNIRAALVVALAVTLGMVAGWAARGSGGRAEAADDDSALATAALAPFYDALTGKGDLADVLGDAFQIMRTDGTRYDRAGYIARHPALSSYKLSDVHAVRSGDVLTVSFFATVRGEIENVGRTIDGEPRLAVLTKVGERWKLQSLATLGVGLAANLDAEGKKAIAAWVGAVASGDKSRVSAVLAPEFQIVRSDDTAYDATSYLASTLPKFDRVPEAKNPVVTGYGDYLIARYDLVTDKGLAPRLTVFRKSGDAWLVVAHANFAGFEQ